MQQNKEKQMTTEQLPFILTETQLTVILPSGGPKAINKSSPLFEKIKEALVAKDYDKVIKLLDSETTIREFFNGDLNVEVRNGHVFIDGETVPDILNKRILAFIQQDLPYEPIVNFWKNLVKNPSKNSVDQLYGCLDHNHHPITSDGCFIAYKAITGDYKDKHTQTISNKIGETVRMLRNKVDDDKHVTCSHGLHVASFEYAKNFMANYGDRIVLVKVNPEHVVSVPADYQNQKLRVCEYTIISEIPNDKIKPLENELFVCEEDEDCDDCDSCCCNCCSCEDDELEMDVNTNIYDF